MESESYYSLPCLSFNKALSHKVALRCCPFCRYMPFNASDPLEIFADLFRHHHYTSPPPSPLPLILLVLYFLLQFYSPSVDPEQSRCDFVFNGTVLAHSHDDIKNLGHTMNDFMNVWAALWMAGVGQYARDISFLNIDALRMGHNYNDELFAFGRLASILGLCALVH